MYFLWSVILVSLCIYSFPGVCAEKKVWDIKKQSIEEKAPDFVLKDLNDKEVAFSAFKGKIVLLVFGTTWCPYCRIEIPYLKELYAKYPREEFEIINIDIQESKKKVSAHVNKNKLPFITLLDTDGTVARLYKVRGVPTKILVSKEGTILCEACRSVDIMLDRQLNKK